MQNKIDNAVIKFIVWLDRNGYNSYDVYDFWSSHLGIYSKTLFNRNKLLATPIVGVIQLLDSFIPRLRILFTRKKRFPLADAQIATAYLYYYKISKNELYLGKAKELLNHLIKTATKTKHGIGWGLPYRWVTLFFSYEANTPLITVTPYCFYAFFEAYKITENQEYFKVLELVSNFVAYDMKETEFQNGSLGASYGLNDPSLVYNAIAYRSSILLTAGELFKNELFITKARKNINYVINNQNDDGSWYYSSDSKFIDNFHTCFVLKNIAQCYTHFREPHMKNSLLKGYEFYKNNFIRSDGTLRHFYKSKYPKFRKVELYDYAEAIKLGIIMKDINPMAYNLAMNLSSYLIDNCQTKKGHFITRINILGIKNSIPYLRWPQAQLFNSLTHLLLELKK